ncbi:hypothetical protein K523DRAFT_351049 [Schizophyllum commune Tattone D]|nr:hypothetical protein K523DRAFT_351049 [Schizophyllum commune Tattone D]
MHSNLPHPLGYPPQTLPATVASGRAPTISQRESRTAAYTTTSAQPSTNMATPTAAPVPTPTPAPAPDPSVDAPAPDPAAATDASVDAPAPDSAAAPDPSVDAPAPGPAAPAYNEDEEDVHASARLYGGALAKLASRYRTDDGTGTGTSYMPTSLSPSNNAS